MATEEELIAELQKDFLDEVTFLLEQCEESYLKLEDPACRVDELAKIFRLAHSMKGAGAAVGFTDLAAFAHKAEDCLSVLRAYPELVNTGIISILLKVGDAFKSRIEMLKRKDPAPWNIEALAREIQDLTHRLEAQAGISKSVTPSAAVPNADAFVASMLAEETKKQVEIAAVNPPPQPISPPSTSESPAQTVTQATKVSSQQGQGGSIKIDSERVENVLNLVGELVVFKSQLMNKAEEYATDLRLNGIVSLMDKTIRELQDKTLGMRMTPLKGLFLKTQRIVRDLSVKLNKPVEFLMSGEDTEIDRNMVELLGDPLMHIARNALDHGIEDAKKRTEGGKTEKGTIRLSAEQAGGRIVIRIRDDGGGLKKERIFKKALEKGLLPKDTTLERLTDREVNHLIFLPGFSTADAVTDVSGRGVGMDVVKTNIEKLKGTIEIDSVFSKGTSFTISIPLTTAITDGMILSVDEQTFVLPMDRITELVDLNGKTVTEVSSEREVFNNRGKLIPILCLRDVLDADSITGTNDATQLKSQVMVVVENGQTAMALKVDAVIGQAQVVLKPMGPAFNQVRGVAGAAIMGDGKVALVLDIDGLTHFVKDRPAVSKEVAA